MKSPLTGGEYSLEDSFSLVVPLRSIWSGLYALVSLSFDARHEEGTKGSSGRQHYADLCRKYEPVCLPCCIDRSPNLYAANTSDSQDDHNYC